MATQLKSALQILSLAVEADETGLFDEAVRLYDRGSCLLEQYLHCTSHFNVRKTLSSITFGGKWRVNAA